MSYDQKEQNQIERIRNNTILRCEKCKGQDSDCSCMVDFLFSMKLLKFNIPYKYHGMTLEALDAPGIQRTKYLIKKEYIDNIKEKMDAGYGIYLWSKGMGTGKTSLGCIILKEAVKLGKSAYYMNLEECVNLLASGWHDDKSRREYEKIVLGSDLLLIDDLGGVEVETRNNTQLLHTTFVSLFKKRSNDLLPTIITSNLSPTELEEKYGKRLYSVFLEHTKVYCLESKDYRKQVLNKRVQGE